MKKLSVLAVAFAAVVFASCGGNKSNQPAEQTDSIKSFEQQQIEASIKMNLDSLGSVLGNLKNLPISRDDAKESIKLTKEELQVKPDYLLSSDVAENAATLTEKYRIMGALEIDRKIAALYEMPTDGYDKAITKLAADINDPSFKGLDENDPVSDTTEALYKAMEQNGRINYFWQIASASLIEQLFILSQNSEKFLTAFNDEAAADATFRLVLVTDAVNRLKEYDPEIEPVAEALKTLDALNATTVGELKDQLATSKEAIAAARKAIIK